MGKKYRISDGPMRQWSVILMTSLVLVACGAQASSQDQSTSTSSTTTTSSSTSGSTATSTNFSSFSVQAFDSAALGASKMEISSELYDYYPQYLSSEGQVYGSFPVGIFEMDLNTGYSRLVYKLQPKSTTQNTRPIKRLGNYLLVDHYDMDSASSVFSLVNLDNLTVTPVLRVENMPPVHFVQAEKGDEALLYLHYLMGYGEKEEAHLGKVSLTDLSYEEIDLGTDVPVDFSLKDGLVYYITDQPDQGEAQVKSYDPATQATETVVTYTSRTERLVQLAATDQGFVGLFGQSLTAGHLVLLDKELNIVEDLGTYPGWGKLSAVGDYVTWTTQPTEGGKNGYELLDLQNKIRYDYQGSLILLSDTGFVAFEYLKDPAEIEKGKIFTNGNTMMSYVRY